MRAVSEFVRDEAGAVTIEFTTLVPAFIMMLVFFTDASLIYLTHTEMFNVARDLARHMATEELRTADAVRGHAAAHLFLGQRTYLVDASFGGEMRVTIAVGVDEAAIFGAWFGPILGRQLVASVAMRREPLN